MQPRPAFVQTADIVPQPWQNGAGTTRELLARPSAGHWRVRVSVADIEDNGPFSTFPGVARCFAVLEGRGVELTIDGRVHRCTASDAAIAFSGEATTHCRLLEGATRDLNLMVRGGRGALTRVVPGAVWRPQGRECGLYATVAGTCRVDEGSAAKPTSLADGEAAAEALPSGALRWWTDAPAALAFDGAGWWLEVDLPSGDVGAAAPAPSPR